MKLRMEFEADDVQDMFETYFKKNGFEVKNMQELLEKFYQAYPEGIQVDVKTIDTTQDPVENSTPPVVEEPAMETAKEPETEVEEEAQSVEGNTRLSMSDILDPTPEVHNVPSRDALMKQRQREEQELQHLLNQSQTIEKEKQ